MAGIAQTKPGAVIARRPGWGSLVKSEGGAWRSL
jgi:hypothetical protein